MGIYSNICELRGRAAEGKGCTLVDGLKFCAKRSAGFGGTVADDCSTLDADALTDTGIIVATFGTPDALFNSPRFPTITNIAGTYGSNFNIRRNSRENDGAAKKYYVSPTGNNGASGALNAPFADLSYALTRADVDVVEIIGLTADFPAYGARGWNGVRIARDVTVVNNTGFRFISVASALAGNPGWVSTMGRVNVYSTMIAQTSAARVCDISRKVLFKDRRTGNDVAALPAYFTDYVLAASLAACEATAGSYWYDTALSVLHVHPIDNRDLSLMGERSIVPSGGVLNANYRSANVTGRKHYLRGVDFVGGVNAAYIDITGIGTTFVLDLENCTFQQATGNNFASVGAETNQYRSGAAFPTRDNWNYHDYIVGSESTAATFYEWELGSAGSGVDTAGTSDNESTAHEKSYGITQNCYFMGGDDNCVSDIGDATRWALNMIVGQSKTTGTPLCVGNNARMFLDGGYFQPGARPLATINQTGRYFTRDVGQSLGVPTSPIA